MIVPVGVPSSSARACVFVKVLLLFRITWLVRKCLPVCVFVLLGRFLPFAEKTDRSICNIQISSRKKKKKCCCGETEKISIGFGIGSAALYAHCRQHFLCGLIFYSEPPTQRHLGEMIHVLFTAVGMNLLCGCLVNHDCSPE